MSTLILTEQNTPPQTPSVGKVKIYATNTNPPEIYLVDDAGNSYPLVSSFENPLTFDSPLVRTVDAISIPQASGSVSGYLSSTDWTTFNSKENVLTFNDGLTRTSNTVSIDYTKTGNVYTGNGLISSSLFKFNGSLYTGGSSTTTKPFMLFEPNGTTSTNWSTEGTWIGINTATGFIGNFLHGLLNNTEKFKFDYTGKLTITSADANINGLTIGKGNGYYANNTAIGIDVLVKRTSGTANTGIGWRALYELTQGEGNNGFGIWALRDTTIGSYNSGLGYTTLSQNTTGTGNSAIGRNALGKNLDGNYNTGIGYQAAGINTAGTISGTNYNVFIGAFTAENIGVGASNNVVIGYDIDLPTSTGDYQLVIGNLIYGTLIDGAGTTVSTGGIGIGVAAVDASARLQIDSTTKGLLIPRWTTAQRTAISSPATALLGYDTDLNSFYYYNGGWSVLGGGGVYTASNGVTLVTADFQIDYTRTGNIYTGNGLVSSPLFTFNGVPFTGGSSTTTKPMILIEPSGTTSTSWSTDGTMFGINAPSGFTGNIIEAKLNNSGNRYFVVNSGGVTLGISGGVNTSFGRLDIYGGNILGQDSHTTLSNSTWGVTTSLNIGNSSSPISKLTIPIAPTASAHYGLVSFGSGSFDGVTSGYYTGNAAGTLIAGNLASGSTSDLINLQVAGVSKAKIDPYGIMTLAGNIISSDIGSASFLYKLGTNVAGLKLRDTYAIYWASGGDINYAMDVGLARSAAGELKVTDGSSGYGNFRAADVIIAYRLGIAVSSNNNVLDVNGNTFIGNNGSSSNGTTRLFIKGSTSDTSAKNTSWLNSGSSEIVKLDNAGNLFLLTGVLSVGHSVIGSAQVHIQKTTEQLRIGYDVSNYYSTTVGSTGGVTFNAVGAGASFTFSDNLILADATNIQFNATTGTKIGSANTEKLAFWGATPIVQITTGVTAAAFVANTSGTVNDTATFDGYTIGQIVKALRNIGILA